MSIAEARAAFPNKHLWYRLDGGRRCWSDDGPTSRPAAKRRPPVERPAAPTPTPRPTSVLWPTLIADTEPPGAALFTPLPATRWPLLLDVDELTAAAELPECCWPPLEPEPTADFGARWFALPSSWFLAAIGERLGQ